MIDYYYEFRPDAQQHLGIDFSYGFTRGYHPEQSPWEHRLQHTQLWFGSHRVWLENANGAVLVKLDWREVHERINPRELTWIKLLSKEIVL
jgi:hypothetical protein